MLAIQDHSHVAVISCIVNEISGQTLRFRRVKKTVEGFNKKSSGKLSIQNFFGVAKTGQQVLLG